MEPSSLGLGTYLGAPDDATDGRYVAAAQAFLRSGGNAFDTAANYRFGRSEGALGQAFRGVRRETLFVSTKAGYLPMGDGRTQESAQTWLQRTLVGPGILAPEDVVDGCHAMTPGYLAHQLEVSLRSLGQETLDLFHLHNPEQQRPALGPEGFRAVMRQAFEACEGFVAEGKVRAYGCATWNGFRVAPDAPEHLSLEELLGVATEAGGPDHHFHWIQLPLNLAMPEAFLQPTQRFQGKGMTPLQAAMASGIQVQTSASIMQARILKQLAPALIQALGCQTPAQAALQFTRSCPGVTVALCGMSRPEHAVENAAVMALPKLEPRMLEGLFK